MTDNLFGIDEKILAIAKQAEAECAEIFAQTDEIARYNGEKVLKAFIDNRVSESCLKGTTGYGYGDCGRDTLDKVFAQALGDKTPDFETIAEKAKTAKVAYIQRSRGYSLRPSLSVEVIGKIAQAAKKANPDIIVMVDNCYGEFVEKKEPLSVGADLIIGSLIKNPGGGIASTGGYICGRADLVEKCADRLTCVGMGKEVGCTLSQNREMLLGFFLSPQTVASAVKTSIFSCRLFEKLGYKTLPESSETRTDIIASILLENEQNLTAFCKGIQKGSPVDSFVTPEAWDMPGYESKVIMAAGAFTMGASIELSADAPIREPFAVWLQGGITYPSGRMGVLIAANEMCKNGLLKI